MGKDEDKQKATEKKGLIVAIPYIAIVNLNPGFDPEIEVDARPAMYFHGDMIVPGKEIVQEDYDTGISVSVGKGRSVLVRMIYSVDAALDLLEGVTSALLATHPDSAERVRDRFIKAMEAI